MKAFLINKNSSFQHPLGNAIWRFVGAYIRTQPHAISRQSLVRPTPWGFLGPSDASSVSWSLSGPPGAASVFVGGPPVASCDRAEETRRGRRDMGGGEGGRGSKKENEEEEEEEEASTSQVLCFTCDGPPVWARTAPKDTPLFLPCRGPSATPATSR